jgi:hypothetical protein
MKVFTLAARDSLKILHIKNCNLDDTAVQRIIAGIKDGCGKKGL